jgi:hypothetical protein
MISSGTITFSSSAFTEHIMPRDTPK